MGKHNKKISDPGLWRRIVREVRDQRIADTEEGKLSTTKIEVVAERYKRRGGEFNTAKKFVSKEQTMATKISKELDRQTRASTRKKKTDK
jgi:hypothetical protein